MTQPSSPSTDRMPSVVFLTRDGCVNTPAMRANLDAALPHLNNRTMLTYRVINQSTLKNTDPRKGYPTPTILVDDVDIFGLAPPVPPFPEPS